MESLFDPSEFGGDDEPTDEPVATQVASANSIIEGLAPAPQVEEQQHLDEVPDDYMNVVDHRLEIAQYYRALLSTPLFDKDTPAARVVMREHRLFIQERLRILLGIQQTQPEKVEVKAPEPIFAPEEIAGLKIIIGQMRAKGMIEASAPAAGAPAPAPKAPAVTPAPVVATRTAPARAPAPTAVTPAAAPAATAPVTPSQIIPPQRARPVRKPGATKPLAETRTVVDPRTDQEIEIKAPRIQRPSGALPFPTDMSTATHRSALAQVSTELPATVSGRPLAAVIAAAVKPGS